MFCRWTRRSIPDYIAGEVSPAVGWSVRLHLRSCSKCFKRYERRESVGSLMAGLTPVTVPADLGTKIRIALSHEADRGFWTLGTWTKLRERFSDALRPLAVPATGGVFCALILFGALYQQLWGGSREFLNDVPLTYFADRLVSDPTLEFPSPYTVSEGTLVSLRIDSRGGIYDFYLPEDQRDNIKLRREVAIALLYSRFRPAMRFGRPVAGTMLIHFQTTQVRG